MFPHGATELDDAPPPKPVEAPPQRWSGILVAAALLLGLAAETYHSRWMFEAYFGQPRQMSLISLRDSPSKSVMRKRVNVRWKRGQDTGVVEEMTTLHNYSKQILDRHTVARYLQLDSTGRSVIVHVKDDSTDAEFDGVVLPVSDDIRGLIAGDNPDYFDKHYCPFYIDTMYLSHSRVLGDLFMRVLAGMACLVYVGRKIRGQGKKGCADPLTRVKVRQSPEGVA